VDLYGRARRALRQVHLWITLVLCLPLVVLGVTGSILVFRDELGNLLEPPPRLIVETGKPHTVAEIIVAVRARIDKEFAPVLYEAPIAPEQPASLRFVALGGAAKGPRIIDVLVDPVTLDFVTWQYTFPGFLRVLIRLHGNLLMGRAGRVYVGWFGVACWCSRSAASSYGGPGGSGGGLPSSLSAARGGCASTATCMARSASGLLSCS
jgi:uncharacterized iron-regulated membrane protein